MREVVTRRRVAVGVTTIVVIGISLITLLGRFAPVRSAQAYRAASHPASSSTTVNAGTATGPPSPSLAPPSAYGPQTCLDPGVINECTADEIEAARQSLTTTTVPGAPLTAQQAMDMALGPSALEFTRVTRIATKVVLFRTFRAAAIPAEVWSIDDEQRTVLVAVAGDPRTTNDFEGRPQQCAWIVNAYNETTHDPMYADCGTGAWPPYFDSLPAA
jgi:hypothetical protein